jgi:hypothetical protein
VNINVNNTHRMRGDILLAIIAIILILFSGCVAIVLLGFVSGADFPSVDNITDDMLFGVWKADIDSISRMKYPRIDVSIIFHKDKTFTACKWPQFSLDNNLTGTWEIEINSKYIVDLKFLLNGATDKMHLYSVHGKLHESFSIDDGERGLSFTKAK